MKNPSGSGAGARPGSGRKILAIGCGAFRMKAIMKADEVKAAAGILVVEDDRRVTESLQQGLSEAGFAVATAARLAAADNHLAQGVPALVVLDLNLPDGDGRLWLRRVRAAGHRMPVIILTARDTLPERVAGLDEGADDYLTKPFAFAELLARIRARLRTAAAQTDDDVLGVGDLEIDRLRRQVRRAGRAVDLTAREFDVLALLAQWRGQPVSRDLLAREVWKINRRLTPLDNVIECICAFAGENRQEPRGQTHSYRAGWGLPAGGGEHMSFPFRSRTFLYLLLLLGLFVASQAMIYTLVEWAHRHANPYENFAEGIMEVVQGVGLTLLLVPLLAGVAWWLARRITGPLNAVAATAQRIRGGQWAERIETATNAG
jgi:two-component system copper resistance phosphate regulon response regulator CusR